MGDVAAAHRRRACVMTAARTNRELSIGMQRTIQITADLHPMPDSHGHFYVQKARSRTRSENSHASCGAQQRSKRTVKVGITGKYGTRYGASLRRQIKKIEISQHSKYTCTFCGKDSVKRKAVGIWECRACKKVMAGGAWTLSTSAAATVRSRDLAVDGTFALDRHVDVTRYRSPLLCDSTVDPYQPFQPAIQFQVPSETLVAARQISRPR
ncbi:60S ribosomal protein [Pseudozyma hubeiensis SY62]|uniref:60S ribosomal protein n=1 Tax=Pseudozyma hubeiensis (strain SY62) TaxID=1305764 RepID=R9NYX4_PSEHS|nr:60S ribosomal protein [Pseudozyma hubeiensis SY62]GAC94043.1 60S ribosomal protein [Pseudozyma hubeiensis SY62]